MKSAAFLMVNIIHFLFSPVKILCDEFYLGGLNVKHYR